MKLELRRIARKTSYTIGRLYVDGEYFCDTLEDADRGLTSDMSDAEVQAKKVKGKTAIPTGTYNVTISIVSPRFRKSPQYSFCGGRLPRLGGVPGYTGILIHCGNTANDTDGCILVGENKQVGKVLNSLATFKRLYAKLQRAKDDISIKIE